MNKSISPSPWGGGTLTYLCFNGAQRIDDLLEARLSVADLEQDTGPGAVWQVAPHLLDLGSSIIEFLQRVNPNPALATWPYQTPDKCRPQPWQPQR